MYRISDNHFLEPGNDVSILPCPKNTQKFIPGQPDTIIIHYTAGRDAESSAKFLARDDVQASAHIVIDREGKIIQLVGFDTIAWHAGKSAYQGRVGFNQYSIGIEIDNAGVLEPCGQQYMSWFGKKFSEGEVIKAKHKNEGVERYWHIYTGEQIETVQRLCEALMNKYKTITHILGHEDISPGRKTDPGPAFPLDKLRTLLIQDRNSESSIYENTIGFVEVEKLNIRELPSINANLVTEPLKRGTKVKILQKNNHWYRVVTEIEGWVSSDYIGFKEESEV